MQALTSQSAKSENIGVVDLLRHFSLEFIRRQNCLLISLGYGRNLVGTYLRFGGGGNFAGAKNSAL